MERIDLYAFVHFGIQVQTLRWFPIEEPSERQEHRIRSKRDKLAWFRDNWLIPHGIGVELINSAITNLDYWLLTQECQRMEPTSLAPTTAPDLASVLAMCRHDLSELETVLAHSLIQSCGSMF